MTLQTPASLPQSSSAVNTPSRPERSGAGYYQIPTRQLLEYLLYLRSLSHGRDLFACASQAKLLDRVLKPTDGGSCIDSLTDFDQESR